MAGKAFHAYGKLKKNNLQTKIQQDTQLLPEYMRKFDVKQKAENTMEDAR